MRTLLLILVSAFVSGFAATAAAAPTAYVSFRTPSGNIGCGYASAAPGSPANLRCDIRSGLKPQPRRPASCDLDFGSALSMGRTGLARPICYGDTVLGATKVLAYGKTLRLGPFSCTSRTSGLTCTNAASHGFFLSRQSWRTF